MFQTFSTDPRLHRLLRVSLFETSPCPDGSNRRDRTPCPNRAEPKRRNKTGVRPALPQLKVFWFLREDPGRGQQVTSTGGGSNRKMKKTPFWQKDGTQKGRMGKDSLEKELTDHE